MELTRARATRLFLVTAVLVAAAAATGFAATPGTAGTSQAMGHLSGTWKGVLTGTVNGNTQTEKIRMVVNTRETAGTWKVNATCHGRLTLDSISNGYHHYRRHRARGVSSSCLGGDVDCLQRDGVNVEDWITPRPGGWARHGTLHRVLRR